MKSWRFAFVALIMFGGCRGVDSELVYEPDGSEVIRFSADSLLNYTLNGRVFTSSDSLGSPLLIATSERRIYVGDNKATQPLLVFNRNTGEFIMSVGERGQGPHEINYLWAMDFKPGSESGWLFEFSDRTMHFFDGDSLTGHSIRLQNTGPPMGPTWIRGDSIASVGMYEDGRLALHGPDGSFGRFIGAHPPGESEVPIPVRQHAYEARVQTNANGSRIAVVSQNTDLIEIYDTEGILHVIRGPGFDEPVYTLHSDDEGDNTWLSLDDETIKSYVDVTVTNDLIFALYSGQTMEDIMNSSWVSPPSETVIVFSWSGIPLAVLNIDHGALAISVSSDGLDLYAIYHRPAPMILHYELPEIS